MQKRKPEAVESQVTVQRQSERYRFTPRMCQRNQETMCQKHAVRRSVTISEAEKRAAQSQLQERILQVKVRYRQQSSAGLAGRKRA